MNKLGKALLVKLHTKSLPIKHVHLDSDESTPGIISNSLLLQPSCRTIQFFLIGGFLQFFHFSSSFIYGIIFHVSS